MNTRLVEWAVTKRGVLTESHMGGHDPSMGAWAAKPAGVPVGAPGGTPSGMPGDISATDEAACNCGCDDCGSSCGCDCCAKAGGSACPTCGKMLMTDDQGCDECMMMAKGWGLDEADSVYEMKGCDECGAQMPMEASYCEACGCSEMVESVIIEAKKKKGKKKGPSKSTQKKIAKAMVKKAGKAKDKEVSMTKLADMVSSWAEDKWAAAQYMKQTAKGK